MSDVTMEKKLQLVQQVRSRYNENQYDLSKRERILYGKSSVGLPQSSVYDDPYGEVYGETVQPEDVPVSSFKLRLFVAMALSAALIAMDINNIKVAGITVEQIAQVISADYEDKITEWVEAISR